MDRTEQEIHMAMSEPKIGAEGEDFWSRHCHMNLLQGSVHGLTFSNMYLQFMESIKYFYIHCHSFATLGTVLCWKMAELFTFEVVVKILFLRMFFVFLVPPWGLPLHPK